MLNWGGYGPEVDEVFTWKYGGKRHTCFAFHSLRIIFVYKLGEELSKGAL
jgi:hypothetical protein